MNQRVPLLLAAMMVFAMVAFAQPNITVDSPFQVRYAANLAAGESWINITNSGATGGNICVNVYTFSPDEQLVSCCSCVVTPNGLVNLGVNRDLISNTLTPAHPTSVVVKLLATTGGACNAATPGTLSSGLLAWGTTLHALPGATPPLALTETRFAPATLSAAELARISSFCGFIQANGSGFGICASCRLGGLGAQAQ